MNPQIAAALTPEPSKGLWAQTLILAANTMKLGKPWRQDVNRQSLDEMNL